MIYAVLGTVAVAMTVLIASKRLSKRQKPTKTDPWGGIGKGVSDVCETTRPPADQPFVLA